VLDPACGSGNFLYVALHALKDLELRAMVDSERAIGIPQQTPRVGLDNVTGIEIEEYAAELARVTLWIGDLQWMKRNGFTGWPKPILSTLAQIEHRDALLDYGDEARWPDADVIIGNPPFVGDKKQGRLFQQNDLALVRAAYAGKVKASANLVAYWFYKAGQMLRGTTQRFGFVSTQAIRRGASRSVVQSLLDDGAVIFDAWSNEAWQQEGASVRVSLLCFRRGDVEGPIMLDGIPSSAISADLRADIAQTRPLRLNANLDVAAQGVISGGPFEIPPQVARDMLVAPTNPDGQTNAAVVRPWRNGDDLTDRVADRWIIDFGKDTTLDQAELFEKPFQHLKLAWEEAQTSRRELGERPLRAGEPRTAERWWLLQRRRSELLAALSSQSRYLATPRVSKHRFFVWLDPTIIPDTRLVTFRRADDTFAGILQSRHHEVWSLRFGGNHGVGNDPEYIHTSTFETFPFPSGLEPDVPVSEFEESALGKKIADGFAALHELRDAWLNPSELVRKIAEGGGLPDRLVPVDDAAAKLLKQRTMTNLHNQRPDWLVSANRRLDEAVAEAYGHPADLSNEEILERLYTLNRERAANQLETVSRG
jgi:type II restriction/modification system DNA methylase subunit YeeA